MPRAFSTRTPALAVGLSAILAGCATPKAPPQARPFQPYRLAPQAVGERPAAVPLGALRSAETIEPEGAQPVRLDAALVRFAVDQRSARARAAKGSEMPEETRDRWSGFFAEIDRFLQQPARLTVPLDVVRARVALDAELDMDREHYSELPAALAAAARARALGLDSRLAQVRHLAQQARPKPAKLQWPLDPVIVTSLFGMRTDPFEGDDRFHRGVDLKAREGQLVQCAAPGVVIRAGAAGGHGLHVEVLHDDGLVTTYSHLSLILAHTGMHIPAGGTVGLAGSTGRSTGPHLHFEVHRDGESIDPLSELVDPAFRDLGGIGVGDGE